MTNSQSTADVQPNETPSNESSSNAIPSAPRIYEYLSGGTFYFPSDEAAAQYMIGLVPAVPKWLRMLRMFLPHTARRLRSQGITHFIDFGSGLPTESHIHAAVPDCKVIYVDIDPYVVSEGKRLLQNVPNTLYLHGDLRHASQVLQSEEVTAFLGSTRRVAVGLSGVSVFFAPQELNHILRQIYDWAEPGAKVYTNFETKNPDLMTDNLQQFITILSQAGGNYRFYTVQESLDTIPPWQLSADGLVPLAQFLNLPADYVTTADRENVDLEFYAAILEKA
jgi:hypothetical protein